MKKYAFNWERHEHKIETEEIRLRNRVDALWMGDAEYLGADAVREFNALTDAEKDRVTDYLTRLADRIAEVREEALGCVRIGRNGTAVAFVDGKTYGALKSIVSNYMARVPAHLAKYV